MIDLYYWPTPNGWKISIMLEECGLPYDLKPVNIGKGEQFKPDFLAISPNNRMPAIVDHEPVGGGESISVFESGAILLYLAEKTGKFLPTDARGKYDVLQWLMWQMGGLGPMSGQLGHFAMYSDEKIPYAIDRYRREVLRLYRVLDNRLADRPFVAGDYSIADMAIVPWALGHERYEIKLDDFRHLARYLAEARARPAVERGLAVGKELRSTPVMDAEAKKLLFGQDDKTTKR
ncbi:MAG: thiol:disulfide oxidoreductase [Polyangiaceae bacterium]|nr:thiol:disulfide oxidoreductase [Polyangiaceae bacterium]